MGVRDGYGELDTIIELTNQNTLNCQSKLANELDIGAARTIHNTLTFKTKQKAIDNFST